MNTNIGVQPTLTEFYSDDHSRLDTLFEQALKAKNTDLGKAADVLGRFKRGLEQHMVWEEAILFSEYDQRISSSGRESPTVDLRFEHEQLRTYLETISSKWWQNDGNTEKDEARFSELLAAHNWMEETGIYLRIDEVLSDQDRSDIFKQMKDSTVKGDVQ